jgi:uncharacterized membrane protein
MADNFSSMVKRVAYIGIYVVFAIYFGWLIWAVGQYMTSSAELLKRREYSRIVPTATLTPTPEAKIIYHQRNDPSIQGP